MFRVIKIILLYLSLVSIAVGVDSNYIPTQAYQLLPVVKQEASELMSDFTRPAYFAGLIEHESCITLTHPKCWNPNAQLKTSREEGIGVGQITRTYKADGSLRFDALSDLKRQNSEALKELSWSNVKQRPDLQIRMIVLMTRNNYKALFRIKDNYQRLAMTDAAYNGGLGGVEKERRACGLKSGCDPGIWFDNVENVCLKSKKMLYGKRNACDINRHHVEDVLTLRMPKYETLI